MNCPAIDALRERQTDIARSIELIRHIEATGRCIVRFGETPGRLSQEQVERLAFSFHGIDYDQVRAERKALELAEAT